MRKTLSLAAALGLLAGMGALPIAKDPDRSQRDSNRMKLTPDEEAHLATLKGKDKKIYVKKLREKYASK